MSNQISIFLSDLGPVFYVLLLLNVVLAVFAPKIINSIMSDDATDALREFWTNMLRGLNVLLIALLGHFRFYSSSDGEQSIGLKIISIIVVIYLSYLSAHLADRFVRNRYGRKTTSASGEQRLTPTSASRGLSIFISVFIAIIALISIIRIAGFSSLLEAGGVIGFIGVFLALTQSAWAPDIISGLIILNSNMFSERDVIKFTDAGEDVFAIVYRTRVFHTELRHLVDNHRLMIRNSRIRDFTVHNLSRFASAKGLRETLSFKIGYDVDPQRVRAMLERSFERACEANEEGIERQYPPEVGLQDAGDHAVEWSLHYYTKAAETLLKTRQDLREVIFEVAKEDGIDLSTPLTIVSS